MTTTDAKDRINLAAKEAVRDPSIKGRVAQRRFMENRCRRDAGMLWALLGKYFDSAVDPILDAEVAKLKRRKTTAEVVPLNISDAGRTLGSWKGKVPGQQRSRLTGKESRAAELQSVWKSLETLIPVRLNGKPVWDVSVREATQWLAAKKRDNRFVELMVSGLPVTDMTIGHYRNDVNEIRSFYNQAEQERKAA